MDSYPYEIIGDSEEAKKRRKKAIQTVKKANFRQYTFDTLTKLVGKGEKHSLKRVKLIGEDEQVIKEPRADGNLLTHKRIDSDDPIGNMG